MGIFDRFKTVLEGKLNVDSRFEILREAVSGTMSAFYMARDRKTDQIVGVKILDVEKTEHFESRFSGLVKPPEGEIAIKMDHPLVVKTLEHGITNNGEQYLIMEFLEGPGLNSLIIDRNELLRKNHLTLMLQMAQSLKYVHKMGYIHRDVCPRNFICDKKISSLKLIDFGLTVPATKEFMKPGNRTGTPNYMAPEVVRRRQTDHRLDIFSFGVTSYQLLALQLPWPGQDVTGKAAMLHDSVEPVDLAEVCPDVDPKLSKLIMQCLAKSPEKRPNSTEDIEKYLARLSA